ncbi:hypothetical protein KC335_g170 [Hortaea werneckii]|nr:hypothetical protein KC335_g170 [Hortaea werneckii]
MSLFLDSRSAKSAGREGDQPTEPSDERVVLVRYAGSAKTIRDASYRREDGSRESEEGLTAVHTPNDAGHGTQLKQSSRPPTREIRVQIVWRDGVGAHVRFRGQRYNKTQLPKPCISVHPFLISANHRSSLLTSSSIRAKHSPTLK